VKTRTKKAIEKLLERYPQKRSGLLPALKLVQQEGRGCLDHHGLAEVSRLLKVPLSEAYGVRTFYTMLRGQAVGKYHLQLDTNVPALLAGVEKTLMHLEKKLGIRPGQVTPDGMFSIETVEDLAPAGMWPVIQIGDRYYEGMTPARVDRLLAGLRRGRLPDLPVKTHFKSACKILLARRGVEGARDIKVYRRHGGYRALELALKKKPEEIVAEVKAAGLRGRGGAGFPTGVKWGFLPKNTDRPVYLLCNADEGEPGTFKDRQILEYDPHLLIEGMVISGYAIGARTGFIYIRGEFSWIADILERAVEQARKEKLLGKGIRGTSFEFDIVVHRGAGSYICGEETALIESLEGKRGQPRIKPPFPAAVGLYGCPTIVNNVETLANVPYIVEQGAEAYHRIGTPNNYGPKIFSISGHIRRPGAYEYPLGTTLEELLQAAGGVVGRLKAVIVGGLSAPILTAGEVRGLLMDYDSCQKTGTMLGSGGIIVMNQTTSIPRIALRAAEFYAHESCGQCTPCRQGTRVVVELLRRIVEKRGTPEDLQRALDLCATIKGSTLCPSGDAFASSIWTMMKKFSGEFEALLGAPCRSEVSQ
jgi:NADH-quinone oxidoreductase F subunit